MQRERVGQIPEPPASGSCEPVAEEVAPAHRLGVDRGSHILDAQCLGDVVKVSERLAKRQDETKLPCPLEETRGVERLASDEEMVRVEEPLNAWQSRPGAEAAGEEKLVGSIQSRN